MKDCQYPDFGTDDFEDHTVISNSEFPVPFERAFKRHAIPIGGCRESGLDRTGDSLPQVRRNLGHVVLSYLRVIAEGVQHPALTAPSVLSSASRKTPRLLGEKGPVNGRTCAHALPLSDQARDPRTPQELRAEGPLLSERAKYPPAGQADSTLHRGGVRGRHSLLDS